VNYFVQAQIKLCVHNSERKMRSHNFTERNGLRICIIRNLVNDYRYRCIYYNREHLHSSYPYRYYYDLKHNTHSNTK